MTGRIDITCSLPAPTLAQVRAWLTRTGWTEHEDGRSIWPVPRWTPPGPPGHALYIYDIADTVHNIARITSRTPEAVYREIVGPVRVYEAVTYDVLGRTSLGIYATRESAPQGGDVSIEEHEVQP